MTNVPILGAVLEVFTEVGEWFVAIMQTIMGIFYEPTTGLTIFGVLAVASLGVATILLVIRLVVNFIQFRS